MSTRALAYLNRDWRLGKGLGYEPIWIFTFACWRRPISKAADMRRPWRRRTWRSPLPLRSGTDGACLGSTSSAVSCFSRPPANPTPPRKAYASLLRWQDRNAPKRQSCAPPPDSPASGVTRARCGKRANSCSGVRVVHGGFDTRDLKEASALLDELTA